MKKNKILIAVFAVMSAASAASAEGQKINFDGRATDATSFMEAIKAVEVSQTDKDIQPAPAEAGSGDIDTQWWQHPGSSSDYCVSMSSGVQWWSCLVASGGDINGIAAAPKSADPVTVKKLAVRFRAQDELRKIVLSYFNAHNDFSSDIVHMAQDARTTIMYDDKNVYLINGPALSGISDKELVKEVGYSSTNQTKFGWADGAAALVAGCICSSDCRHDVVDYVNNLSSDDEPSTWHNENGIARNFRK